MDQIYGRGDPGILLAISSGRSSCHQTPPPASSKRPLMTVFQSVKPFSQGVEYHGRGTGLKRLKFLKKGHRVRHPTKSFAFLVISVQSSIPTTALPREGAVTTDLRVHPVHQAPSQSSSQPRQQLDTGLPVRWGKRGCLRHLQVSGAPLAIITDGLRPQADDGRGRRPMTIIIGHQLSY